jgi:hypothetical protein
MTDPIIGRKGKVKLGGVTIANLANFRIDIATDELDGSVFGTGWGATLPGQQKWKSTISGFLDMTDITGQLVLKAAKMAGTKVTNLQFFESDGGSYWGPDITEDSAAGAYVGTMAIDEAQNGLVKVDYSIGGVGPIDRF